MADPATTRIALARALLKYAHHAPGCYCERTFERECDCGWYALRSECQMIVATSQSADPGVDHG